MVKFVIIGTQVMTLPPESYSGLEKLTWQLANGLSGRGHEVYLAAPYGSRIPDPIHHIDSGPAGWSNPEEMAYRKYNAIVASLLDDETVVLSHSWQGKELALLPHPKMKMMHTFHGPNGWNMLTQTGAPIKKLSPKLRFYGVSRTHADHLSAQMGLPVGTLYNGVDPKEFWPAVGPDKGYLLYLGRIDKSKGVDKFLDGMYGLQKRILGIKGYVAGDDRHTVNPAFVDAMMYACSNAPYLEYFGTVSHQFKKKLINESAGLVFSFHEDYFEAFNLTVIEAFLSGKPVFVTENGSMDELFTGLPWNFMPAPNNRILWDNIPSLIEDSAKIDWVKQGMRFSIDKMIRAYEKEAKQFLSS